VNGGGNYNRPKVRNALALVKPNYMRENPQKLIGTHRVTPDSKNPTGTGTIRREDYMENENDDVEPSETLRSAPSDSVNVRFESQWVVGFVDGEGCFFVGINPHPDMTTGFQVLPEFTVVQHERDVQLLHALKAFFGCGVVRQNNGDRMCYRVRDAQHLRERIVPFFEKHPLKSKKQIDFAKFRRILIRMERGEHLTTEGIETIRSMIATMNTGRER
jgi:LAGLIDADG endonuclease